MGNKRETTKEKKQEFRWIAIGVTSSEKFSFLSDTSQKEFLSSIVLWYIKTPTHSLLASISESLLLPGDHLDLSERQVQDTLPTWQVQKTAAKNGYI